MICNGISDYFPLLLLYLGSLEEDGSQFLPQLDLDSGMHTYESKNVRDLQPLQKDQERVEMPVQEDTLTKNDTAQYHNSNGAQTDSQNHCREPVTLVGGTAVNVIDMSETCDTTSDDGGTNECEDVKFIPNEPCTVATGTWVNLPNQLCRLCASTDEHPKQSIVGWLGMLNEIIPDLVSYVSLFNYHHYFTCLHKCVQVMQISLPKYFYIHLNINSLL
jgi:hypothetical protein